MNISDIEKGGGFVDGTLIKKSGIWKRINKESGLLEDFQVEYFVKLSSWLEYQEVFKGIDAAKGLNPECLSIVACIRLGADGSECFTYEQAAKLDSGLFNVFRNGIAELYAAKR
jgi:hypothetical protein